MLAALLAAGLFVHDGQPTAQAEALVAAFAQAQDEGLDPADYALEGPDLDAALTAAAERYASDLARGRVDPRSVGADLDRAEFDAAAFVRGLAEAQDVAAALQAIQSPLPVYRRVREALREYRRLAAQDRPEAMPLPARPLAPAPEWEGFPRLVRLLRLTGDWHPGETARVAVTRFQLRHGLAPTGLLDRRTVRALNVPLAQRALQLELALERIRWMPHQYASQPIVVNIPEFRLRAGPFSMRVVVGRAFHHRTPMFIGEVRGVIFRPSWSVPLSIARSELLPEFARDPSRFDALGFELRDRSGAVVDGDIRSARTQSQVRSGELRLRQKPGPANALGLVKLVMPNRHSVYLHGTPAQRLFERERRDFSHGCIRVEDPQALAQWLLPRWTPEQVGAAMTGTETLQLALDRPVPVLIVYGTASVGEDGDVRFTEDIYGLDAELSAALQERIPAG